MLPIIMLALSLLVKAPDPSVVLITLDGVMWQDIYGTNAERLVPFLYSDFVQQGIAVGKLSLIIASGPNHISLPGYLEITRGYPSTDCQRNDCNPIIDHSLISAFERPAVFSSWGTIEKVLPPSSNVYSDIGHGYRYDQETIKAVNLYLNHNTPDFLWVSLGDTDEWAHANSRSKYLSSLQLADTFIHSMVVRYPNSTFIITTDHGRNWNFRDHGREKASERVWLMMRGPKVSHKGLIKTSPLRLSNIYPTVIELRSGIHSPNSILEKVQ
jgi:hypothetical protein